MSNKAKPTYFLNSGTAINASSTPTSDFNTDSISIPRFNGTWQIEVFRTATDGSYSFTLEASMDGTNWEEYSAETTGISLTTDDHQVIIDDNMLYNFIRVAFTISNSPTGNLTAKLYKYN